MEEFLQPGPPAYLLDVIEFTSLHYLSRFVPDCCGSLQTSVQKAESSVEKVQAFLLLTIVLHGRQQPDEAKSCLAQAIQLSLELGLHRREISDVMSLQNPVQAECLRRTWWELVVVDVLLAAVQLDGVLQFHMTDTPDVPLPCEQEEYQQGCIVSQLFAMADLELQSLLCDSQFSSFAYRVEAALLLRKCLLAGETHISLEALDSLSATITGWFHRLPKSKRAILPPMSELDEMMLQATALIHCASIYLHFPRSSLLAFLPISSRVFCSQPPAFSSISLDPQMHTAKVAAGAVNLSKLASLSTAVANHTPFFACILNLSSILQVALLAAECLPLSGVYQPYLTLNMGVLMSMSDTWPVAGSSMQRIREIVMEIQAAAPCSSRQLGTFPLAA
ncbi:hypothetical protein CNMCM5623_004241 [Aspergillus felis]|uniref:Xylanolytic transcriptional activator regulatory domain-containing protein n=1 Tax=Aspergillus felis TaxID=1287682 RepID=A0A8H6QHF9_9EURO|nr:hypothetical protein CNMCM5623_004241 [Aspergillus felis]